MLVAICKTEWRWSENEHEREIDNQGRKIVEVKVDRIFSHSDVKDGKKRCTRAEMKELREKAPRNDQLKQLKSAGARGITRFVNDAARGTTQFAMS